MSKEAVSKGALLGVDLGGTLVRVGKVRGGELERHDARRISGREGKDVVLDEIFRVIDQVFDEEVIGIGFGVPSVVDVDRGIVYAVENIPSWQEVPLKEELERRYGVPAYVNTPSGNWRSRPAKSSTRRSSERRLSIWMRGDGAVQEKREEPAAPEAGPSKDASVVKERPSSSELFFQCEYYRASLSVLSTGIVDIRSDS